MPLLFVYFLKLSISLAIVYLFYQLVLRRLTFYNSNRWYLVCYTLLAFFIPFINITPVLDKNEFNTSGLVQFIPVVENYTTATKIPVDASFGFFANWDKWDWSSFVLIAGTGFFLLRFIVRCISFFRLRRRARLISGNGLKLYQVNKNIMPFSFGNAVFINSELHTEEELREIIRHEFVHVKQMHTLDIIWSESLCIINWYNPFAWLLKRSMRQNLEFIADNKVLQNGVDRKQYQYLLLKVIGNNHFSIAPKFNFSSLKKRIIMMNKIKSARLHLVKFLFILPMLAVMLLAFRSHWKEPRKTDADRKVNIAGLVVDARTKAPLAGVTVFLKEKNISVLTDAKGYYHMSIPYENKPLQFSLKIVKTGYAPFHQQENWGNFYEEHIRSLYGNTFEFFGLGQQENGQDGFSALAGRAIHSEELNYEQALKYFETVLKKQENYGQYYTDTIPEINEPNEKGYIVNIKDNDGERIVVVKDKKGKEVEKLSLTKWNENNKYYNEKYGKLPPPPPPLPPVPPPGMPVPPVGEDVAALEAFLDRNPEVKDIGRVYNNQQENLVVEAHIIKKDGTIEKYNLKDEAEITKLEKKYGKLPPPPSMVPPVPPVPPVPAKMPEFVRSIERNTDQVEIWLKNGKKESYNLKAPAQKKAFEKKYGELLLPPVPDTPLESMETMESIESIEPKADVIMLKSEGVDKLAKYCDNFEITDKKATMHLKTGETEVYDLTNTSSRGKFEKKYGTIIDTKPGRPGDTAPVAIVNHGTGRIVIAPMSPLEETHGANSLVVDPIGHIITGDEDVLVTITKKTTREQLEEFVAQMKEKGIELKFDKIQYEDGKLVNISGTMKSKDGHSNFSASDFSKLVLATIKDSNRVYFKVKVTDNKVVI